MHDILGWVYLLAVLLILEGIAWGIRKLLSPVLKKVPTRALRFLLVRLLTVALVTTLLTLVLHIRGEPASPWTEAFVGIGVFYLLLLFVFYFGG